MSENGFTTQTRASAPSTLPAPSGPSMATVVWGLVLLSLAALAALTQLTGWEVDPTLAVPAVLLGAGALLVVTAAVAVARRPRASRAGADETPDDDQQSGATRPSDPV